MAKRALRSSSKSDSKSVDYSSLVPSKFKSSPQPTQKYRSKKEQGPYISPLPDDFQFPEEIWTLIFNKMGISCAFQFSTISKQFYQIIYNSVLSLNFVQYGKYRRIISRTFEDFLPHGSAGSNLSTKCIKYFQRSVSLKKCINLTSLTLGEGINMKCLMNLTYLDLSRSHSTSDLDIMNLTNLRILKLEDNRAITDNGISKLINLTSLNIKENEKITNLGLKNLSSLTTLYLGGNVNITDDGISHLVNLKSLFLSGDYNHGYYLDSYGDDSKKDLPNITDSCLSNLTNLTYLSLFENIRISNNGIKNLTNLTGLNLSGTKLVTDDGLENMTKLIYLNLDCYEVRRHDYEYDNNDEDDNNEEVGKHYPHITDSRLMTLTNLSYLSLSANNFITINGIQNLTKLVKINITNNQNITEDAIKELSLPNLREVGLKLHLFIYPNQMDLNWHPLL